MCADPAGYSEVVGAWLEGPSTLQSAFSLRRETSFLWMGRLGVHPIQKEVIDRYA